MSVSRPLVGIALLVVIGIIIMALVPGPAQPREPAKSVVEWKDIVQMSEPVSYCPPPSKKTTHGRVQVLLDSSGSMFGVRRSVVSSLRWLEQGLSRLRDSAVSFDELRIAQFDAGRGILPSANFAALVADYDPGGRAALHQAIQSSRDYDLTLIVTGGVAAAGTASGDCTAGVDAACVARALADAVHLEQTAMIPPRPGIWLIPLWVRHSGLFPTEEPTTTAGFDGAASLQELQDELGQVVSIANARSDSEGNLVFDYTGPRGILLIIIARSDDLGRRAVSALRERMAENQVAAVTAADQASGPVSAFPAIELYPGYLPGLEWLSLEKSQKPLRGVLDAAFRNRRMIAIECAAGRRNEGELALTGRWPPRRGCCVDLYQLPAFEFELVARNARDEASVKTFIAASKHKTEGDREQFALSLQCGGGEPRPCASDPVPLTWVARSRYGYVHAAGAGQRKGGAAILEAVATTDLIRRPHRIYGLESLVAIFFDEVRRDRRRIPLADLELCHGPVEQP